MKYVTNTLLDELSDGIDIQYTKVRSLIRGYDDSKLYDMIYLKELLNQINKDRKFIYHLKLVAGGKKYTTNEYIKLKVRYNRRQKILERML